MTDKTELRAKLARAVELKTRAELQVGHFIHRVAVLESALRRALAAGDSLASHAEEASAMYGVSCEGVVPTWEDESRPGYEALTPATKPETTSTEQRLREKYKHLLDESVSRDDVQLCHQSTETAEGKENEENETVQLVEGPAFLGRDDVNCGGLVCLDGPHPDPAPRRQEVTLYRAECGCPVDEHDVECPERARSEPIPVSIDGGKTWRTWKGFGGADPLPTEPAKCEHGSTSAHGGFFLEDCPGPKPEAQRTEPPDELRRVSAAMLKEATKESRDEWRAGFYESRAEVYALKAQLAEANTRAEAAQFRQEANFAALAQANARAEKAEAAVTALERGELLDVYKQRDAERKAKEEAQAEVERLDVALEEEMKARDEGQDFAASVAIQLGCEDEWSNCHDHFECVPEFISALRSDLTRARELQAQAERDLRKVTEERDIYHANLVCQRQVAEQAERERDAEALLRQTERESALRQGYAFRDERDLAQSQVVALRDEMLGWKDAAEEALSRETDLQSQVAHPVDMLLFCPRCAEQHVDEPQPEKQWTNPPHRSHECQFCGYVWRPSDRATNGVWTVTTQGKVDGLARPQQFSGKDWEEIQAQVAQLQAQVDELRKVTRRGPPPLDVYILPISVHDRLRELEDETYRLQAQLEREEGDHNEHEARTHDQFMQVKAQRDEAVRLLREWSRITSRFVSLDEERKQTPGLLSRVGAFLASLEPKNGGETP